jgi:putative ABC transport system permease protein
MINFFDTLVQDVRYSIRTLARNPSFAITALIVLMLGIGANTAIFSVVYGILYRPLPYPDSDRIAMVYLRFSPQNRERGNLSVADFLDWRAANRAFEDPSAFTRSRFDLTGFGEPEQVIGATVTSGFFSTLRVEPLIGRSFTAGEDAAASDRVVIISEDLWRRRFGASPDALGKVINVNGAPHTIVGVMPSSFRFPYVSASWREDTQAWANLRLIPPSRRGPYFLQGIGRLKPNYTLEQAQADTNRIGQEIEKANHDAYSRLTLPVMPLRDSLVGDVKAALLAVMSMVSLLLLIATMNVAVLLVARATSREREMAIRLSLGASPGRLMQQHLTESMVLSALGGLLGISVAYAGAKLLHVWNPGNLPRIKEVQVDWAVLFFTCLISIAIGIAFGLLQSLKSSRANLNATLHEGGRSGGIGAARSRTRSALFICEVAFSFVLLVGSGLLIRSLLKLQDVDPGFHVPPERLVTMLISPPRSRYAAPRDGIVFYQRALDAARAVPGVESAAISDSMPPNRQANSDTFQIEGRPPAAGRFYPSVTISLISADYLQTMGIRVLRGRAFTEYDNLNAPRVVIISESMAREFFGDSDPIGKRIKESGENLPHLPYMEIVGVVEDVKFQGLDRNNDAAFYMPYTQNFGLRTYLVARTREANSTVGPVIQRAIRALDPDVVVNRINTLEQIVSDSSAQPRFRTFLASIFAGFALILTAVGVYGVLAYLVAQRFQEFGIRMALGARPASILRLVVRHGCILVLMGVAFGIPCALLATRILSNLLFSTSPADPLTFIGISLLLIAIAIIASLIPAYRATRVDPLIALRHQ